MSILKQIASDTMALWLIVVFMAIVAWQNTTRQLEIQPEDVKVAVEQLLIVTPESVQSEVRKNNDLIEKDWKIDEDNNRMLKEILNRLDADELLDSQGGR